METTATSCCGCSRHALVLLAGSPMPSCVCLITNSHTHSHAFKRSQWPSLLRRYDNHTYTFTYTLFMRTCTMFHHIHVHIYNTFSRLHLHFHTHDLFLLPHALTFFTHSHYCAISTQFYFSCSHCPSIYRPDAARCHSDHSRADLKTD